MHAHPPRRPFSDLREHSALPNPPAMVKMALEPITLLLGGDPKSWQSIRSVIGRPTFTEEVIKFDTSKIPDPVRKRIETEYFSQPQFTHEAVDRASKACGPVSFAPLSPPPCGYTI